MAGNSAVAGQSVSGRLLAVLDCFDVAHSVLTLTEIAARAELPLSTARRLISELVDWGGLERVPGGRHFRIGIRLWRIGSLAPRQRVLSEAALPFIQDLCEATQENVQLAVLDDGAALCIEKISSQRAVPTATLVGGRLPLHATAVGKVLLAFSPPQVWRDLAAAGLTVLTRNTIVQPGTLAAALDAAVEQGIAYSYEEMTLGAVSVAAPVHDCSGVLQGALGIVTHSHLRVEQLGPAVRTAALGISRRLS
ncbi:IclR family transcriptional regulator [Amycolatopsis ultiminotia]|uniref:IclR family transcriptional regulator n=1 Tax=Amycolatopsis ultiminotia TaxID=543629 RepID=A0ABP6W676_9PSEU